ncbi:hypothetical protein H8D85_02005 [bacterium]|nr:hypothetical protein [bacterium]
MNKDEIKQGEDLLKKASEELKSFTENLGKNPMVMHAKTEHLNRMSTILASFLKSNAKEDFTDPEVREKVSKAFAKEYESVVLSPLGM